MLLRLLLFVVLGVLLGRVFRYVGRRLGAPPSSSAKAPRSDRRRSALDPRRRVEADWTEVEGEERSPDD